jgi:ribosomal protein S27AE
MKLDYVALHTRKFFCSKCDYTLVLTNPIMRIPECPKCKKMMPEIVNKCRI